MLNIKIITPNSLCWDFSGQHPRVHSIVASAVLVLGTTASSFVWPCNFKDKEGRRWAGKHLGKLCLPTWVSQWAERVVHGLDNLKKGMSFALETCFPPCGPYVWEMWEGRTWNDDNMLFHFRKKHTCMLPCDQVNAKMKLGKINL